MAGASSAGTVTCASSLLKEVYNPKAVIPHAALLDQASAHCPIFPTAASRRSLGRVSVPVWLDILSDQLPVVALVGHYPTNKLIGREPIPKRLTISSPDHVVRRGHPVLAPVSRCYPGLRGRLLTCYSPVRHFPPTPMRARVISGINHRFRWLSQSGGQITHVLLTRSPLEYPRRGLSARLACVRHAASVRPEPGSNSPSRSYDISSFPRKARGRRHKRKEQPSQERLT